MHKEIVTIALPDLTCIHGEDKQIVKDDNSKSLLCYGLFKHLVNKGFNAVTFFSFPKSTIVYRATFFLNYLTKVISRLQAKYLIYAWKKKINYFNCVDNYVKYLFKVYKKKVFYAK